MVAAGPIIVPRRTAFRFPRAKPLSAPFLAGAGVLHIIVCWRLLSVLKADKKAIFTAASKASEAAAFLAALQGA
jgi:hypothetical protein